MNSTFAKHSFAIKVSGKRVATVRAADKAAAKRIYCTEHSEVAREAVTVSLVSEALPQ